MPFMIGPGPMGQYLDGVFPNSLYTGNALYRPAFTNLDFSLPIVLEPVPFQDKLVVGQLDGKIYWFEDDEQTTTKSLVIDLSDQVGMVWDSGLLGFAFHPKFNAPGNPENYIYVYYSSKDKDGLQRPTSYSYQGCYDDSSYISFLILERYTVNPVTMTADPSSRTKLIVRKLFGDTHRGGGLGFGDDGFLYLTTGDQAAWHKSQDIVNNMDGGVLRIDVDKRGGDISREPVRKLQDHPISGEDYNSTWYTNNGGPHPPDGSGGFYDQEFSGVNYYIPNDNPFLSPSGASYEEYYTIGHRSPHRMFKDRLTGKFYIGEVGLSTHEEINVVVSGKNYGWPVWEGGVSGPTCNNVYIGDPETDHELPLTAFPRTVANSITGGFVYRGSEFPDYYGKYICADYGSGEEIFSVNIETGEYEVLGNFSPGNIISFGQDKSGELFILHQGFGTSLYKLTQGLPQYDAMPQTLSASGAFIGDLSDLNPKNGIIPYDLVESFWSDGALKRRWMAIPNDGTHDSEAEQIAYSEEGDWDFPEGSVIIKHFDLNTDKRDPTVLKKVETRFMIKKGDGNFYFLTYNWDEAQTDAILQEDGLDEIVNMIDENGQPFDQTWHYPSNSECIACHNSASKGSLGLRTRYLNKDFNNGTGSANQLVTLSSLGIIDEVILDQDTPNLLTGKSIYDANATLDEKARSYLDLNCAYCHRSDNLGIRPEFDLRLFNSLEETGLLDATVLNPLGIEGEEIIVPGDASKSILFHRMNSLGTIMMPPIAKSIVDEDALTLIEEWIDCSLESIPANTEMFCKGNWYNGSGPDETSGTKDFIIGKSTYTVNEDVDIEVNSLEIKAEGSLVINPGGSLKVNGNFINNGTIELESNSIKYSSLVVDGLILGTVNYKRYTNLVGTIAGGGNDLVSPPVTGQKWSDFLASNGPGGTEVLAGNNDPYSTSTIFAFGPFNKSNGEFQNYTTTESPDPVLNSGMGYRAATTSGGTLTFTGSAISTDFSGVSISETGSSYSKWNLIGNPYPSYLKANDFLSTNVGILDPLSVFIYGYNGSATGSQYDLISSTDDYLVAPGQGFFVASNATGGAVQFKTSSPDMRSSSGGQDFITLRSPGTNNEVVLEVLKQDNSFTTTINFRSNSSLGVDPGFDGAIFGDNAPEFSLYSHLVQDNTGRDLAIQSLAITDMNDVVVPLGINASQGQQLTVGIASSNFPGNINVYLEDNLSNIWTLLNTGDYVFTPSTNLIGTGRFFLHFSSGTLSSKDNLINSLQIYAENHSNLVWIKGQLLKNTVATIYDLKGRVVMQKTLNTQTIYNSIKTKSLSAGIYIVELSNDLGNKRIHKIIIE